MRSTTGSSLQLLTYLLVLEASGEKLFGEKVTPVAAFYAKLLCGLDAIDHPDEAPDENDPAFDLCAKPRGVFDGRFIRQLDELLDTGSSEVVAAYITKDNKFGKLDSTDVAEQDEFAALLAYVKRRIAELADQMIDGIIEARPYRIGKETPCANCDYRAVCRFETPMNQYLSLSPMKRTEVLAKVVEESDGD